MLLTTKKKATYIPNCWALLHCRKDRSTEVDN